MRQLGGGGRFQKLPRPPAASTSHSPAATKPEGSPVPPPTSVRGHADEEATCPAPPELFLDLARAGQKRPDTVYCRTVPAARRVREHPGGRRCCSVLAPLYPLSSQAVSTPRPNRKVPSAHLTNALRCQGRKWKRCKGSRGNSPKTPQGTSSPASLRRASTATRQGRPKDTVGDATSLIPTMHRATGRVQRKRSLQTNYRWDGSGFSLRNVSLLEAML